MDLQNLGTTCVIGLFWGDEGKGKIVDVLTEHCDVVVRYNGGANAGHTVVVEGEKFALHLVPSGVLHSSNIGVIGPGVALNPKVLLDELDMLASRGVQLGGRLKISNRCHLVMPYHIIEDRLSEESLSRERKIGTTARGIGPCYADKMLRSSAIRFCDLFKADEFKARVRHVVQRKQTIFEALHGYKEKLDAEAIAGEYLGFVERLEPFVCDTTWYLQDCLDQGMRLLFEGAHGTLLDIDHGTYPYVTSSTSSAVGVSTGAGVPPSTVQVYLGVVKAYTTRVGQGPFPTEQQNEIGDRIRNQGQEFGTTTGRPRRCGWFDAVAARYGVQLGGIGYIAVMHLDTLSGLEEIKICVAYEYEGREINGFPAEVHVLEQIQPVYETMPGWPDDISNVKSFGELPQAAQDYILKLEQAIGVPVFIVSVGPERRQTIFR